MKEKPQEVILKDSGRECMLGIDKDESGQENYMLYVDDIKVTELPQAPPILKENIPVVCQSENYIFSGEVTVRKTFNVWIESSLS